MKVQSALVQFRGLRGSPRLLPCALLLFAAPWLGCNPAPASRNVVIIVVDTLRTDALGAYGNSRGTSPNLDELARESVVFDYAWAQSTYTPASFVSYMTSTHVRTHGWDFHVAHYPEVGICGWDDLRTLAEVLSRYGFESTAWVANDRLEPRFGFPRGFDLWNGSDSNDPRPRSQATWMIDYVGRAKILTHARRELARWMPDERHFLYLHLMDPHLPQTLSPEARAALAATGDGSEAENWSVEEIRALGARVDGETRAATFESYLASVWDADSAVGEILAAIDENGHRNDTVVVFFSDHGEEIWEHGTYGHFDDVWEQLAHVPLMIRAPGLEPGRRGEHAVALLDVAPTVLDLLGIPEPPGSWQGQNLFAPRRREGVVTQRLNRIAVTVDGRSKLRGLTGRSLWQRFELSSDPTEKRPQPVGKDEPLRRIAARWAEATPRVERDLEAAPVGVCTGLSEAEREHHVERLRALGYVE